MVPGRRPQKRWKASDSRLVISPAGAEARNVNRGDRCATRLSSPTHTECGHGHRFIRAGSLALPSAASAIALPFAAVGRGAGKSKGVSKLVQMLDGSMADGVRAEAAAALAELARGNQKNQEKFAAAGGIAPLVDMLQGGSDEHAKEEAASALWSLSSNHFDNQVAIADAGGIAPLVAVLGLGSVRAQEQAAGALASLALGNTKNELSIAKLIVSFLEADDKTASAKAARAVSRLARAHKSNQRSLATAGGLALLVKLLDVAEGGVGVPAGSLSGQAAVAALEAARVQKEMASALWSMSLENEENQAAIAQAGGIPPLIALLDGHPEVHRDRLLVVCVVVGH